MDRDLKDSLKKIEEKKSRYEKTERLILILSGLVSVLIFAIIGLNVYTGLNTKISEPEVVLSEEPKKPEPVVKKEELKPTDKPAPVKISKAQEESKKQSAENTEKIESKKEQIHIKTSERIEKPLKTKEEVKTTKKLIQNNASKNQNLKALPAPVIPEKTPSLHTENKRAETQYKYSIQLAAFKSRKNAERYMKKLKMNNTFIYESKGFYRVMVGKFKTKKEAIKYKKEHRIKGYLKRID